MTEPYVWPDGEFLYNYWFCMSCVAQSTAEYWDPDENCECPDLTMQQREHRVWALSGAVASVVGNMNSDMGKRLLPKHFIEETKRLLDEAAKVMEDWEARGGTTPLHRLSDKAYRDCTCGLKDRKDMLYRRYIKYGHIKAGAVCPACLIGVMVKTQDEPDYEWQKPDPHTMSCSNCDFRRSNQMDHHYNAAFDIDTQP